MRPATLLCRDNTALMIIDVQGQLAEQVAGSHHLIPRLVRLIKAAEILSLPLVWVEQYPKGLGATVKPVADAITRTSPLVKTTFNACETASVRDALSATDTSHVLVCGIEAHVCVYQTVAGLLSNDYGVSVITDCCSSRSVTDKSAGLARMNTLGAQLRTMEMALFELIGDASDPVFRQILPLIK